MTGQTGISSSGAASTTFGVVRIGKTLLALPVEVIREVVPRPDHLLPLASSGHLLCGAIELRAEAIPVINIAEACGQSIDANAAPLIVIIRHEGALLGLLADAVADIATVRNSAIRPLIQGAGAVVTNTFMLGPSLVNLLDPGAILGMPGVPHVRETVLAKKSEGSQRLLSNVLFRVQGATLCFPAHEVDGAEPETAIIDSPIMTGDCEGIIHYHGQEVPIIDTVPAMGLGWPPKRPRKAAAIVLRFPNKGLLAFRIDEVVDIASQDESLIRPVPPGIISQPDLFRGIYVNARNERVLVLDTVACRAAEQFLMYANLVKPIAQGSASADRTTAISTVDTDWRVEAQARQAPYLLANCGTDFATPVAMVSEVIALPEEARAAWAQGSPFLCAIIHRQSVVPIYALERLLSSPSGGDLKRASVLLIRLEEMTIGFAVNELNSIQRTSQVLKSAAASTVPSKLEEFDMVRLRRNNVPIWVPMIDLPALARSLTNTVRFDISSGEAAQDANWQSEMPAAQALAQVS